MQFSGKSVIITGAGKGIGRACAQLMVARGATVIALGRTQSDLDSLAAETGARTILVDLADTAATRAAMAAAGTCDYLINSAGINVLESVLDMSDAGFDAVIAINLRAALVTSQAFARPASQPAAAGQSSTSPRSPAIAASRTTSPMPRRRPDWKAPRASSPRNSARTASASTPSPPPLR